MRKLDFGETNLGAVIGAVFGAVGGLVAVAIPLTIIREDLRLLASARPYALVGFLVSAPVGWLLGGQISQRFGGRLGERSADILGGILGGLLPVGGFILWGWYLIQP